MKIYHFSSKGEYCGESIASQDPITGEPMLPGSCTFVEPTGIIGDGQTYTWNGSMWAIVDKDSILSEEESASKVAEKAKQQQMEVENSYNNWGILQKEIVNGAVVPRNAQDVEDESIAEAWRILRINRNGLLNESDFTQLPDNSLTVEEKAACLSYRQVLRDLPENVTDPREVEWPVNPLT